MTNTKKDTVSRDWFLTFPYDLFEHKELIAKLEPYSYVAKQEISDTGYHHYHVYLQSKSVVKFSTLKNKFPKANIQMKKGSSQQLYDYVTKEETTVPNTLIEKGDMKLSNQGSVKKTYEDFRSQIQGGMRYEDLILSEAVPGVHMKPLKEYYDILQKSKAKNHFRDVEVNYLYGESGVGKSRLMYEMYGFDGLYRVNNYKNPFDNYDGEKVLVLDEFYESIEYGYLLNVLDGHPLQLSARYADRWAEYDTVWMISNRKLSNQYTEVRDNDLVQYRPFIRRIDNYFTMDSNSKLIPNKMGKI